jgi:hypothetical protein
MAPKSAIIIHEARQELMNFISFEAQSIINRRVSLGEEDYINPEEGGFYEIDLTDYNINQVSVTVSVWTTWDLETTDEIRLVKKVLLDSCDNEVYVLLDGMNLDEEDPLHIRSFSTDDIKNIGCALEEAYAELCKVAPKM